MSPWQQWTCKQVFVYSVGNYGLLPLSQECKPHKIRNFKGEGSWTTRTGLVNRGKIKVNKQRCLGTVLCAKHYDFQDRHLFSCVDPLLLCYRVLNMGRVALFWCFSVIFNSLIANLTRGTATLQNFDSVEIWSFPIKLYMIDFVSRLWP